MISESRLDTLIKRLSDKDGRVREKARLALEDIGKSVSTSLIKLLASKDEQTRWEAAKALVAIADPSAIPSLIDALEDNVFDIRWLAGEALVAIGPESVLPLIEALVVRSGNSFLIEGASHVI